MTLGPVGPTLYGLTVHSGGSLSSRASSGLLLVLLAENRASLVTLGRRPSAEKQKCKPRLLHLDVADL